jgi:Phosphotransferase enzyme family
MRVGRGPRLPLGDRLRAALGTATVVRRLPSSPRWRVWLAEFDGGPAIVKQITGGDDAGERFSRESTALRLARRVRPYVAGLARSLAVPVPPGLTRSLDDLLERVNAAGRYALLHGDPCPDNAARTSEGIRFIDLEQASLGGGYTELAYLRIGFPTCWCATSVPEPVLGEAEGAYRSTWRSLTGAEPGGDLADACAGWLIRGDALVERAQRGASDRLARLPEQDWRWGTATARQRLLHRLTTVAALGADHPDLTQLSEVSAAMRDVIRARWPSVRPLGVSRGNPLK